MATDIAPDVPAQDAATNSQHTYEFNITMTCSGCSGAVERVLKKMDGIQSYDVSLPDQTAKITADPSVEYSAVLEKIKKTGKKVNTGKADGVDMDV